MRDELSEIKEFCSFLKSELDNIYKQQQIILENIYVIKSVLCDLDQESQKRKEIKRYILKYWYLSLIPAVYMVAGSKAVEGMIRMFL